jgi:uncharacterized protein (TIGR00661 family)
MKILYGVMGEGMGHAVRSRVVIEHLLASGHAVEIMASSRARDFLAQRFGNLAVTRIRGLHLIYAENRVVRGKTFWSNVQAGLAGVPRNIAAYFELIEGFKPEVVISDFESWVHLYGLTHRLPMLSLDNMHVMTRCALPAEVVAPHAENFRLTQAFVKGKLPFCSHYIVTTFFRPLARKRRTTLVPPLLRPEILQAKPTNGEHLLVYQTSESHSGLVHSLQRLGLECRVYGLRRDLKTELVEGNLRYKPFDEQGFIQDLASARGVIAGGGFTLMGEAVYLHKPMLSIPVRGQFEQVLNARYLEHVGYGKSAENLEDDHTLRTFVDRLPQYREALETYQQVGNTEAFTAVDAFLDRAAAGIE